MFAPGHGGVVLTVALLLVVVALVSPPGRRAAQAAIGSVGRWPGLIRSELRGDAPLDADERRLDSTTPEIPVVDDPPLPPTRSLPQVGRRER